MREASHWPLSLSGDEQLTKGVPGPPRMSSQKGADAVDRFCQILLAV